VGIDCATVSIDVFVGESSALGAEINLLGARRGGSEIERFELEQIHLTATVCCSSTGTGYRVSTGGTGGAAFEGKWGPDNKGNGVESHTEKDSKFDKSHDAEAAGLMSADSKEIGDLHPPAPDKK